MTALTLTRLKRFAPNANSVIIAGILYGDTDGILFAGGIDTSLKLCHFLGQCFVESGGFTELSENLHYSAARLMQVWPRQFSSTYIADAYANDPEKLANFVYGGRLGNVLPGDGYRYRGGGILQLTGRSNYARLAKLTGLDLLNNPDLARDPRTCLQVAALVWSALNCNSAAAANNYSLVTQRINGGQTGAHDRVVATNRAKFIFTVAPIKVPVGLFTVPDNEATGETISTVTAITDDFEVSATPPASVAVPLTTAQAKALQARLKAKNYSPGDINGDIHNPATVGAIAELQKQSSLPVTGEVDDVTEDQIENAPNKVVSDQRANETVTTLRAKGSQTILAADATTTATHGVIATGVGLFGCGGASILSAIKDQITQVRSTTDVVPGLTDKITAALGSHLAVLAVMCIGVVLIVLAGHLYSNIAFIKAERVRKSASGEDMSH